MNIACGTLRQVTRLMLLVVLAGLAFGGAPSMKPDMPREIQSWRDEILSREEYEELVGEWRSYIKRHPKSAVAYVQLARAMRYARQGSAEERNELVKKALELDPSCPEALDAFADTGLHSGSPLVTLDESIGYAERAVRLAPEWAFPHFTLWPNLVILGRYSEADQNLRALVEKGAFPSSLLDFNHNMLVSADSQAIIFTNGDNDTYPAVALQAYYGLREDVAIVNLSLLNRIEYAQSVWKRAYGHEAPFTEKEITKLHDAWKKKKEFKKSGTLFATKVMLALLEKVRMGEWTKPVYFAITVAESHLDACQQALEIEGILWRVKRERKPESQEEGPRVNVGKTLRLFQEEFRLESATDLAYFRENPRSAVKSLMRNYPALLRLLATDSAERGDLETVRFSLKEAIRILAFHEETDWAKKIVDYWKELDPNNPEVDRWAQ